MVAGAAYSDKTCNRAGIVAAGWLGGAICMGWAAQVSSPWWTLVAFTFMGAATAAANGPFWAMSSSLFSGVAAAGSIALINSIGNLGGFVGPTAVGIITEYAGGYRTALFALCAVMAAAGLLALLLPVTQKARPD